MFQGSVSARSALEEYHATLSSDAIAQRRLAALHQRYNSHAAFLPGAQTQVTPTWPGLEERVESDVGFIRALLGLGTIWSPMLCDRLRARCTAHGPQSFIAPRSSPVSEAPSMCLGGGPVTGKALAALLGASSQDGIFAHAWVYRFVDPVVAIAHLLSHPAFGAGASPLQHGDEEARVCTTARVALIVASPLGTARQTSNGVVGGRRGAGRGPSPRFVVVMVTWHAAMHREAPLGPDLAGLADMRGGRPGGNSTHRREAESAIEDNLRWHLSQLQDSIDNIGIGEIGEVDAKNKLQTQLSELLTQIADVWALRDAMKEEPHRPLRENSYEKPPAAKETDQVTGRLTMLEDQVRSLVERGLLPSRPQEPVSSDGYGGVHLSRQLGSPPHVRCRLEDLSPVSDTLSAN